MLKPIHPRIGMETRTYSTLVASRDCWRLAGILNLSDILSRRSMTSFNSSSDLRAWLIYL